MQLDLPGELQRVLLHTPELSRAYLVGGCVRDALLHLPVQDFDIEVFGVTPATLEQALRRWGRVDLVGRAFGVWKVTLSSGAIYDFSLPRRDAKVASGHRGFVTEVDPGLPLEAAAARRDFTINALLFDPRRNEVLDFFDGQEDLRQRRLRHTSGAFVEDPLRVLRGMQFAGRFDLVADEATVELCQGIAPAFRELPVERVGGEWFKWAARSVRPSAGLRFLQQTGWLEHFPELHALATTPQDPQWHPEGDVFAHTCHCCDALARHPEWHSADESGRTVLMLAVLTHDFGKAETTRRETKHGRECLVAYGHEQAGVPLAQRFLERIAVPNAIRDQVLPLIENHMAHLERVTDRAVRRLARRLAPASIAQLCTLMAADQAGRPPLPAIESETVRGLRARSREMALATQAPQPILRGRLLLALGMTPGTDIGRVVDAAFEAQLDGAFADEHGALRWLAEQPDLPLPEAARQRLAVRRA